MPTTYPELLEALQLNPNKDPFGKWNAAEERDILPACFVSPPFFESVFGNPQAPSSSIVFAPTGAGKTAQCVIIQERSSRQDKDVSILSIVYDDFQRQGIQSLKDATLTSHLKALTRVATIALLSTIGKKQSSAHLAFSAYERDAIRHLAATYVGLATSETIEAALRSIRTPWQKFSESINAVTTSAPLISIALKLLGHEPAANTLIQIAEAAGKFKPAAEKAPHGETLQSLQDAAWFDFERVMRMLAQYHGAVYILIDRVDETPFTSKDAQASFKLVEPLLVNLELLNPNKACWAFKFFLWDGVEKQFAEVGRTDRIPIHKMKWKPAELVEMLNRRLGAYSSGAIQRISDLFHPSAHQIEGMSISDLIVFFSHGSPRDSIRICHNIINAHLDQLNRSNVELNKVSALLSVSSAISGIHKFAELRFTELVSDPTMIRQMHSVRRTNFTSTYLSADVFKINRNSVTGKIGQWANTGAIVEIGEQRSQRAGKPRKLYGFPDPRLALGVTGFKVEEFLRNKLRKCPNCHSWTIRDWDISGDKGSCICGQALVAMEGTTWRPSEDLLKQARKILAQYINRAASIDLVLSDAGIDPSLVDAENKSDPEVFWNVVLEDVIDRGPEPLARLLEEAASRIPANAPQGAVVELYYSALEGAK